MSLKSYDVIWQVIVHILHSMNIKFFIGELLTSSANPVSVKVNNIPL